MIDDTINFELLEDWAINYLGQKHKSENLENKTKGQKVKSEFKKLGEKIIQDFPEFLLAKCTDWQNSGYIYQYLWMQFKHKEYKNNPSSISIFIVKDTNKNAAKLLIETEIDEKNAQKSDYEAFSKALEKSTLFDNSWYWEDNNGTIFDTAMAAINSLHELTSKKIKIVKHIQGPYSSTESKRIINELKAAFKQLIPCYKNIYKYNEQIQEYNIDNKSLKFEQPKNQILYGPPGTGKTYSVRQYITDIVGQNPGLKTDNEEQKINNAVKDLTWYSAIALSMYRNGKNNKYKVPNLQHQKIIKAFAATKESKKIKATLWFQMQSHTSESSENVNNSTKHPPYLFDKTENSEWYLTETGIKFVEENLSEQLEFLNAKNSSRKIEDFYKFITFHQSYSYEEFVEGIKPSINNDEDNATISYEYNRGIFKEICQQANSDPENNYLLIIDEINRGNISKIFGELITLIESDKRVIPNGERIFENTKIQNEELVVTLPYTKSKFGVPSNLYILGTMNTSDRSIASIDIALRRRFKFVEMMPRPEKLVDKNKQPLMVSDINLQNLLKIINERISYILDRDHQIGHSYFMNWKNYDMTTLKNVWFDEIMPLLNEYFYADWDKLQAILGKANEIGAKSFIVKIKKPNLPYEADCSDEEAYYNFVKKEDVNETDFRTMLKNAQLIESKSNVTSKAD
jgi:GTPase subunit of restriction endonuclease-like protein